MKGSLVLQVVEELLAPSPFAHVEFALPRTTPGRADPPFQRNVCPEWLNYFCSPYVAFYFFQAFYKQIIRCLKIKYWDVKIGSYE